MSRTLLQLIQQTANELGIPEPSLIISGQDDTSKQLLALANREGKDFSVMANANGGWQNLHKEYSFQTDVVTLTGDVTSGSAIITNLSSTSGLAVDTYGCTGTGIGVNSFISTVDSSTQVTLTRAATVTGVGVTLTFGKMGYALPSDFEYFSQRTFWDGAQKWEILGAISAQEKQVLRWGVTASSPRRKFHIRNNKIWLDPMPSTDGETISFDYYSNAWCESSVGVAQQRWVADTDVYRLDEDCFVTGLKWRYLRSKGLDYAQEKVDYDNDCQRVMSRDGGYRDLNIGSGSNEIRLLDNSNIPDSGYGS